MFRKKFQLIFCLLLAIIMVLGVFSHGYAFTECMESQAEAIVIYENDYLLSDDNFEENPKADIMIEDESDDLSLSNDNFISESKDEKEIGYPNEYEDEEADILSAEIPIMPFMPYHSGIINGSNNAGTAAWTFDPMTNTVTIHGQQSPTDPIPTANQQGRGGTSPWARVGIGPDVHYIVFDGPVNGAQLLQGLFAQLPNLRRIYNLHYLNTSAVGTMQWMFSGSTSLISVDVSTFDTSNVTNFNSMFNNSGVTEIIGLENFDVSNATNVSQMFMRARNLQQINTTGWSWDSLVGSAVTAGFNQIFEETDSLHTIIGIETWNVDNVRSFNRMFRDALSLQSLDLSNWNVGNVIFMNHMFHGARGLQSVNTTGWNTSNVTHMNYMFANSNIITQTYNTTHALTSIHGIENWNTANVIYMNRMFSNAFMLPSLDLTLWNTGSVQRMDNMFSRTYALTTIGNVSSWNTSSVTTMQHMFYHARSLTNIDAGNWDVGNVTNMHNMFAFTLALSSIGNVRDWNTGNVTTMAGMFRDTAIPELNLSNWNTGSVTDMFEMFRNARYLQRLNIRSFSTANIGMAGPPVPGNMQNMFMDTFALQQITLGSSWSVFNGNNITNLPAVPNNGFWRNVGRGYSPPGTVSAPAGGHALTSDELMGNLLPPDEIADTWIWVARESFPITFDLNGGSLNGDTANITYDISEGLPIGANRIPEPILRENFTFVGWRYEGQTDNTPNLTSLQVASWIVTESRTFVAQWIGHTHTVVFDINEGHVDGDFSDWIHTIPSGHAIGLHRVPTPSRFPTHSFTGWRYDGQEDGTPNLTLTEAIAHIVYRDITFTAQWITPPEDIYEVIFALDGGTYNGSPEDISRMVYVNQPVSAENVPEPIIRTNYTFAGWRYNGQAESTPNLTSLQTARRIVTGPQVFTAQWESEAPPQTGIVLPVTYAAGDGVGGPFEVNISAGSYTLLALSETNNITARTGYRFIGWLGEGTTALRQPGEVINVTGPTILTAQWTRSEADVEIEIFTVTYTAGTGIGGPFGLHDVSAGNYTLLALSETNNITARAGYRFIGWIVEGTTTLRQPGEIINVNRDLTITAQWQRLSGDVSIIIPEPVPQQSTPPPTALLRPSTPQTPSTPQIPSIPQTPPTSKDPVPMTQNHIAYIIGYTDGYVRPNNNITRAEVATIFFRLMSDEYRAYIWNQQSSFPDVMLNNWFNNAISTLTNDNLLLGYPDGYFRPNQAMTRAEFSALIVRIMGYRHATDIQHNAFMDTSDHWAESYINAAHALGWIQGYGDGTFRPDRLITRAEAAALVNRALARLPEFPSDLIENMAKWSDNMNENTWYYLYIQEATNSHQYAMKADGIHETWIDLIENREWWRLERSYSTPYIFKGVYIGSNMGMTN